VDEVGKDPGVVGETRSLSVAITYPTVEKHAPTPNTSIPHRWRLLSLLSESPARGLQIAETPDTRGISGFQCWGTCRVPTECTTLKLLSAAIGPLTVNGTMVPPPRWMIVTRAHQSSGGNTSAVIQPLHTFRYGELLTKWTAVEGSVKGPAEDLWPKPLKRNRDERLQ